MLNNTLEQQVTQLQRDNDSLERKLKQAKQELNTMKTITSRNGSRIGRAKSETDLSKKFDKYTSYDRHKYTDMEPTVRSVSFATRNGQPGARNSVQFVGHELHPITRRCSVFSCYNERLRVTEVRSLETIDVVYIPPRQACEYFAQKQGHCSKAPCKLVRRRQRCL